MMKFLLFFIFFIQITYSACICESNNADGTNHLDVRASESSCSGALWTHCTTDRQVTSIYPGAIYYINVKDNVNYAFMLGDDVNPFI